MELKFKETNKTFHKIIEVDGEKYLLDMTSISPKTYFWGSLPSEITAKCLKLDKRDTSFESLAPTMSKSLGIGIGVAIGGACYGIVSPLYRPSLSYFQVHCFCSSSQSSTKAFK